MKIVLAPDKYKGNMSSPEICSIIRKAFLEIMPDAEMVSLPMADGGEGTVDAMVAAGGGEIRKVTVTGPLGGRKVEAVYGIYNSGKSAVLEMASASGMALVPKKELNPLLATTYGTGELIKVILDAGVRDITIGIGGSATVDGGAGMAQALGYSLLDASGRELPHGGGALENIASIDSSKADSRIFDTKFKVACDVTNPLLGSNGAAHVYGPQKGATPDMVVKLEKCLGKLASVWIGNGMLASVEEPGDGAAGGLGAGLRAFCRAVPSSGARLIMNALEFDRHIRNTDLVITGEGCTDSQTESGKLCCEVAKAAHAANVPVMLLSGGLKGDRSGFNDIFDFSFSISSGTSASLEEEIAAGRKNLYFTARNLAALISKRKSFK